MQITIKGRHWKVTPEYREYAERRIEKLQRNLGIPLPAATQWELVAAAAATLRVAEPAARRRRSSSKAKSRFASFDWP